MIIANFVKNMKRKLIILLFISFYTLHPTPYTPHSYAFVSYDDTNCGTHVAKTGGPCEDVKNTRHNLSSSFDPALGTRNVFTAQTTEICVFCHTPHGANPDALSMGAPIWNRRLPPDTGYTMYDQVWSKSFEGQLNSTQPTGFSRLCLSCHDGTIALSRLINPPGSGGFVRFDDATSTLQSFSMTYQNSQTSGCVGADCIPIGAGVTTGDTRLLGVDLRNDHAISFVFDSTLSSLIKDDELQQLTNFPNGIPLGGVALTQTGVDADLTPLKRHVGSNSALADSVQCTSCHNPHQVDFPKFLRANRVQSDFPVSIGSGIRPAPGAIPNTAIICVFCHDKPGVPYGKSDGSTIANAGFDYTELDPVSGLPKGLSTHFTDPTLLKNNATDLGSTTADQLSSPFILNPTATQVSVKQRACLACHDPHTEQGSLRLLRSGADNSIDTSSYPLENSPTVAIEQTCYMCHSPAGNSLAFAPTAVSFNIIDPASCATNNGADCPPDIFTQFRKDFGTSGPDDDPAFSIPEFAAEGVNSPAYPAGENVAEVNGSAMNLRLGPGHHPVFVNRPAEGVQMNSDNFIPSTFGGPSGPFLSILSVTPAGNKTSDLVSPDTKHVECVDCHNMHRVNRTNRFRGMPGITIDLDNPDQMSNTLLVAQTLNTVGTGCDGNPNTLNSCRREPFIFEVCLRCHGNSFNQHVREQTVFANGTGLKVQYRGNKPLPTFTYTGVGAIPALGGGSNKRKEFDPNAKPFYDADPTTTPLATAARLASATCSDTVQTGCNNGLPGFNTSFHPVATTGTNQSGVLDNCGTFSVVGGEGRCSGGGQLMGQDHPADGSNTLSRLKTIHCTDCHNTNLFGKFGNLFTLNNSGGNFPITLPDFPGPITFDNTRGTPYKRSTDLGRNVNIPDYSTTTSSLNNPNTAQGPHGSIWRRILRANYSTLLEVDEDRNDADQYNSQNFALCFNCHNEAAFITETWSPVSGRLTNFYRGDNGGPKGKGNLHRLHLVDNMSKARCHECHNNVHSNIEAGNTLFVNLPGLEPANPGHASSTHLINFAPHVGPNDYNNPVWGNGPNVNPGDTFYDGPGCNLKCHGQPMVHNYDAHSVVGAKCTETSGTGCQP